MFPGNHEKENQGVSRFKFLTFAQLLLYGGKDPESMPNIIFLRSFLNLPVATCPTIKAEITIWRLGGLIGLTVVSSIEPRPLQGGRQNECAQHK